MEGHKMLSF